MSKEPETEIINENEGSEQLPSPPPEHTEELKMEKRLKHILEQMKKLSPEELQYYSRQIMLDEVGYEGQSKLKKAKICIVGLGGLGSIIATQLAAAGVGHLRLVDRDIVEESNLQRQHLYSFDFLGYPKVEAAIERLKRVNPYIELEPLPLSFNAHNASGILKGADAVVDGLDNMKTRYSVNRACIEQGIPYIFGSAISTFGNVSTIIPKETACLECFYGNLDDTLLPSCATVGVHQSAISIVASVQVAETLKMLLGKKSKLRNKLLYIDIESMRFEEINVVRAPSCPVCGEGRFESSPPPSRRLLIEETCGRNRNRVYIVIPREDLKLGMKKLTASLEAEGKQLDVKARLGVTFTADNNVRVSLLKSGIMILEGAETQEEALDLYEKNVLKRMNIPWI